MKNPIKQPKVEELESVRVLKALSEAHRFLAELKGIAYSIPNENIAFFEKHPMS